MVNQRLQTVGMAAADLEHGYIALVEKFEVSPNEVRHQHSFGRSLHQNCGIGEEKIAMLGLQVSCNKTLCVIFGAEHLFEIDHRGDGHDGGFSGWESPE